MKYWWEADRARLQDEIGSFAQHGATVERDEESFRKGKAALLVKWPHAGGVLDLRVVYPDFYPFFTPKVAATGIALNHHQNPRNREVCLLQSGVGDWNPEETAAALISEQMPKVLTAETSRDRSVIESLEVIQAEPVSSYFEYQVSTSVLIDGGWKMPPELAEGQLVLGLEKSAKSASEAIAAGFRGAVLEVKDTSGRSILTLPDKLSQHYNTTKLASQWFRLKSAPPAFTPNEMLDFLRRECPGVTKYLEKKITSGGEGVVAFIFPEESGHRVLQGEGWIFYAFNAKRKKGAPTRINHYFARAFRAGEDDVTARIPELRPLRQKCVAVIGLGCVGSPSVMELARCGVGEIRILENDLLDPGNSCRWPLGIPMVGHHKFSALQAFIAVHYPYVIMDRCLPFRLGDANSEANQAQALEDWLQGVDLIYDASGDPNVQLFMSCIAWKSRTPYVLVESRPGGYGGLVARFLADRGSGCYYCFKHRQVDGYHGREGGIGLPPQKRDDFVQPQGCIAPTFTATSFDTSTVSLAGVRMAASILCSSAGGYPEIVEDVAVLSVRDGSNRATFPMWSTHVLKPHPECSFCRT